MKASTGALVLFAALVPLVPQLAAADPPPASFDLDFSGDAAIWNPFDGFEACETIDGVTGCLSLDNIVCDGKGSCVGDAEFSISGGGLSGLATGPAAAKARCKAGGNPDRPVCKAKLSFDTTGMITGEGLVCDAEIGGRVGGPVDAGGFFEGKGPARICLACPGERKQCGGGRGLFEYTVDPPTPWSVTVQVTPNGKKLEGTATDTLGFSYDAKGAYNAKKDESKLSLRGLKATESSGARISLKKLVTTGSSVTEGTAKVSVQGNRSSVDLGN